jgi:hypothetical protein
MAEEQHQGAFGGFEQTLGSSTFNENNERSRYDKLLSQSEMTRLREIMKKESISIEEISEVMNIAVSTEIKLTNFNENDRYYLGKYLIWIGEYAKRFSKALRANEYYKEFQDKLSPRTKELRLEIIKDYTEQFKNNMHSYFFLARSPLSLEGTLIDSLTRDKKEVQYNQLPGLPMQQPKTSWLG